MAPTAGAIRGARDPHQRVWAWGSAALTWTSSKEGKTPDREVNQIRHKAPPLRIREERQRQAAVPTRLFFIEQRWGQGLTPKRVGQHQHGIG